MNRRLHRRQIHIAIHNNNNNNNNGGSGANNNNNNGEGSGANNNNNNGGGSGANNNNNNNGGGSGANNNNNNNGGGSGMDEEWEYIEYNDDKKKVSQHDEEFSNQPLKLSSPVPVQNEPIQIYPPSFSDSTPKYEDPDPNEKKSSLVSHLTEEQINSSILNNVEIDEYLYVICVISNPCHYKRRVQLCKEFINRLLNDKRIKIYLVETVYGSDKHEFTDFSKSIVHIPLKTINPLWHKENMINIGMHYLPKNWKAVAWIDADIQFENPLWSQYTLKILNNPKPVILQIFSHTIDLNEKNFTMAIHQGFFYQYCLGRPHSTKYTGPNYFHCGYGYAMNRVCYDTIMKNMKYSDLKLCGPLYDKSILGSGDFIFALSLINKASCTMNNPYVWIFKNSILSYQKVLQESNITVGYVPTSTRHHYHGSKVNRKYIERNDILYKYKYNPDEFIKYNQYGVIEPTDKMDKSMLDDIMKYFKERNEDEKF